MKAIISTISFVFIVIVLGNVTIVAQQNGEDMKIDAEVKRQVIENLARDISESYVFPEVASQISSKLNSNLTAYNGITSAREFAEALTKEIQAVNGDKHLRVRFSPMKIPVRKVKRQPTAEEIERNRQFMRRVNYGFDSVKRLNGNIGYIELRGFMNPKAGADTVASAMNFVSNTDALIIDLRRNGGGSPGMVALICSYFFGDEKVHLNDLYWRKGNVTNEFWTTPEVKGKKYLDKPIYLLTSGRTFSAAEEFSYNLQNLKRATIIGETTGGGAHPGGSFRLHDHFSAFISTGRAINPITKTNWEGTGVKPEVEVKKDIALEVAKKKALKHIHSNTEDPRLKASLERELGRVKKKIAAFNTKSKPKQDAP